MLEIAVAIALLWCGFILSQILSYTKAIRKINRRIYLLDQHHYEPDPRKRLDIAIEYAILGGDTDLLYSNLDQVLTRERIKCIDARIEEHKREIKKSLDKLGY